MLSESKSYRPMLKTIFSGVWQMQYFTQLLQLVIRFCYKINQNEIPFKTTEITVNI